MIKLHYYQREAVDALQAAYARGVKRPAIVHATGAGKSVALSKLASEHLRDVGGRVAVVAHRIELIENNAREIEDVDPSLNVGVVKGNRNETRADVVSCSVQTLAGERRRQMLADVSLVIIDECFPAGTTVGGVPIERLAPGDLVPSWDESTGGEARAPVTALMKRRPDALVRVVFDDGRQLVCTPNHPIMTDGGWCPAGGLWRGASVVSFTHGSTAIGDVHGVRNPSHDHDQGSDRFVSPERTDVLLRHMSGRVGDARQVGAPVGVQQSARVGAYEGQQSDGQAGDQGQDGRDDSAHRAQAKDARGKRVGSGAGASTPAGRDVGLADGSHSGAIGRGTPVPLQAGHREYGDEDLRRSGRGIPYLAGAPILRPTEGRAVALARVDHVEVLEPGCDGTYGGMCSDGLVYNVEVAGTHTYLVNEGIVVHNCHRAAAKSYLDVLRHYGCYQPGSDDGARAAGFTATMVRGDDKALGDVWQEIVHTKDIASLVQEGFLVRPRGLRVRVEDLDLSKVKKSGGDYQADSLGEALEQSLAPEAIAKAMREHASTRKTVLFAPTVHSAQVICEALKDSGFTAAVVHAGTPDAERRQVAEDSRTGKVQIVCNALLYTEGTNWPWLSCVVIARPTRSKGTFVQMAGRGLRLYPSKSDCLIMMIGGSAAGHSLLAPVELFGASAEELDRDPCICGPDLDSGSTCECGRRRCTEFCPCGGGGQDCGCPRPTFDDELQEGDDLGELLEDIGANGPLVAHEVDLFAGSTSAWDQTFGGVWFLPAGKERLIAIVPGDPAKRGGWDVVAMNAKGPGSRWVVKGVSELAYAMAHADGEVTTAEATIARKEARWRSGRPSDAAADLARRMGIMGVELMTAGEVSRHLTKTFASKRIDKHVPEYARRQLVGV